VYPEFPQEHLIMSYKAGKHKATCQRCGKWYLDNELKKEWTGLIVCSQCWELQHPQMFVRPVKDKISVSGLVRDEHDGDSVSGCATRSAIAGCAVAGCAIVGSNIKCPPTVPSGSFTQGL
jgi:hypothetical protein